MSSNQFLSETRKLVFYLGKWIALTVPMALVVGTVVALFLYLLNVATETRFAAPWIVIFLPIAGVAIVLAYERYGGESSAGNNLILDRIHEPGGGRVPLRMAPLVLLGTVVTHLFGGSAGREGTAVQIGGSIASRLCGSLKLTKRETRIFLMAGVAAGFGSVFGTPLTGAIFALEVVAIGRLRTDALIPCLLASIIGDLACVGWGIDHTVYSLRTFSEIESFGPSLRLSPNLIIPMIVAGAMFGLAARLFSFSAHALGKWFKSTFSTSWHRPVVGALIVLIISLLLGTMDYMGLGVRPAQPDGVSIVTSFSGNVTNFSWFWKLLLTTVTIASGFKGGEVTPLFFIGATLGAAIGMWFGLPVDLMAAVGFVAVFAGATNTPIACTIMGIELFGSQYTPFLAVGCFTAFLFSGTSGIYSSQKVAIRKGDDRTQARPFLLKDSNEHSKE